MKEENENNIVEFSGEDVIVPKEEQNDVPLEVSETNEAPAEDSIDESAGDSTDKSAGKPKKDAAEDKGETAADSGTTTKKKKDGEEKEQKPTKVSTNTGVLGNKTLEDVIAREAKEEQDTSSPFSLSRTLGGVIIARAVQKQIWLVLLIGLFFIAYISMRYICQQKIVEIAKIEKKMIDAHYKATVCTSELTKNSRESNIMKLLSMYGDSTLTIPKDPPFYIKEQ